VYLLIYITVDCIQLKVNQPGAYKNSIFHQEMINKRNCMVGFKYTCIMVTCMHNDYMYVYISTILGMYNIMMRDIHIVQSQHQLF